ncbi:MAG: cell division protein ZapA [Gemmatimonadota bacterium]
MTDGTGGSVTSVTVRIAGEEYVIRSAVDPDYTRDCAREVDRRIREVREMTGLAEAHKAPILVALALTDEVSRLRAELEGVRKEVSSRATNLLRRMEVELDGSPSSPPEDRVRVDSGE